MTISTKLRQFLKAAALTLGLLSTVPSAHAALSYNDGDVFVCFRATAGQGALKDIMINVGSVSQFIGVGASFTVNLGANALSDLNTTYGSNWSTRADVRWSVSGNQFTAGNGVANRTLFASRREAIPGVQSAPWKTGSINAQNPVCNRIVPMTAKFAEGNTNIDQTESGSVCVIQDATKANSFASLMQDSTSYQYFTTGGFGIENTFANGTNNSVLDFYIIQTQSPAVDAPLRGAFRLDDSATLTFFPTITSLATPALAFSSAVYSVNEDDASAKVTLTIQRSNKLDSAVTVNFSTVEVTAFDGVDFTGQTDTAVEFLSGETSKTVDVSIIDVAGFAANRTFKGVITVPPASGIVIDPKEATVTIVDTDPLPSSLVLNAATYSIAENGGMVPVTITRSGTLTTAVSVTFSTTNGSALGGTDFTAQNMQVDFAANDVTKIVNIPITNRAGYFGDRNFTIALANGTNGATLGTPNSATVTIQELDAQPATLALSAATYNIAETGGNAVVTINRTGSTAAVSVNFSTTDGTALGGTDFTAQTNTQVDFAIGDTSKTVNVAIINRAGFAGDRTFTVALSSPSGVGQLGTLNMATVTITETDPVPPVPVVAGAYNGLLIPTGAASHNASGFITLKVTAAGAFTGKVAVGGFSFSVKGTLASNGDAKFGKELSANIALVGKAKPPVALGNLALHLAAGKLTGTLGATASVDGDLAYYDGKTKIVSSDFILANKGKFTVVIPSETDSASIPQGDGIGLVTVTAKGAAKFAGTLADGTKFTATSALSEANKVAVYALLYSKKGSFAGAFTLDTAQANSDLSGSDFLWIRPAQTNVKHYLAGWPAGTKVDVLGAKYVVPAKTANTSVFPSLNQTGGATLTFADGKINGTIAKDVTISTANKVTTSDKTFKLSVNSSTGGLSGDFAHTDSTKTKYVGVIFQKGATKGGYGYFLSNVPKNAAPGESGRVTLLAK